VKVLLDECIPKRVKGLLIGHDCQTVPEVGSAGKKNGELLTLAEQSGFDVLITVDKSIARQQNLSERRIALVVIRAQSNELEALLPHIPACLIALRTIKPGQIVITE
jgi:hypothetical protein